METSAFRSDALADVFQQAKPCKRNFFILSFQPLMKMITLDIRIVYRNLMRTLTPQTQHSYDCWLLVHAINYKI